MIQLAYDGSLNGDWVSRHALRIAMHEELRRLRVVHVLDGSLEPAELEMRLDRIEREAEALGVSVERAVLPRGRSVWATLEASLPRSSGDLTLCGTRVRPRRGFLAGTISERLLRGGGRQVAAIRVVQPGLLGDPRSFLVPVSERLRSLAAPWPFLHRFLAGAERVVLLAVPRPRGLAPPYAAEARERRLRREGWRQLDDLMQELRAGMPEERFHLDGRVALSSDWPREILVHANQLHARMIVMGASTRTLLHRAWSDPLERILRGAPCDVAICRGP